MAALVSTLAGSIFASTIAGLGAVLREAGHELLLGTTEYSSSSEEAPCGGAGRRPGGLVPCRQHTPAARRLLERATRGLGVPVVEICSSERPVDMAVGFSNFAAGRAMTAFLADLGYRRIAFVGVLAGRFPRAAAPCGLPGGAGGTRARGASPSAPAGRVARSRMVRVGPPPCSSAGRIAMPSSAAAIRSPSAPSPRRPWRGLAVPGDSSPSPGSAISTMRARPGWCDHGVIPGERDRPRDRPAAARAQGRPAEGPVVVDLGFELVRRRTA
ncbi:MAG: hypothetical protein R3D28_08035 [Geminicoccaceae bacterium]